MKGREGGKRRRGKERGERGRGRRGREGRQQALTHEPSSSNLQVNFLFLAPQSGIILPEAHKGSLGQF